MSNEWKKGTWLGPKPVNGIGHQRPGFGWRNISRPSLSKQGLIYSECKRCDRLMDGRMDGWNDILTGRHTFIYTSYISFIRLDYRNDVVCQRFTITSLESFSPFEVLNFSINKWEKKTMKWIYKLATERGRLRSHSPQLVSVPLGLVIAITQDIDRVVFITTVIYSNQNIQILYLNLQSL